MGVKDLLKLLSAQAPNALEDIEFSHLFGRKIAVDAMVSLYQFLIAMQVMEKATGTTTSLVDKYGNPTSHLQGLFYRSIKMLSYGIKPIFVFDGKPPEIKADELNKRSLKKEEAERGILLAIEEGDTERINKLSKRTTKVTPEIIEEAKKAFEVNGHPCG